MVKHDTEQSFIAFSDILPVAQLQNLNCAQVLYSVISEINALTFLSM